MRILVVLRDANLRTLVERFLSRHHHEVATAGDAGTAWQLIERGAFHRVIVDHHLAGRLTGVDLVRQIRACTQRPDVAGMQVILTSSGEEDAVRFGKLCRDLGVVFLPKVPESFNAELRQLLGD